MTFEVDDDETFAILAGRNGRRAPHRPRVVLPCDRAVHPLAVPARQKAEDLPVTQYAHASKCPSSRPPHDIRTGAIAWMLNLGWPPEDIAERTNADVRTIEQHYDNADVEKRRRRHPVDSLDQEL